MVRLTSKCAIAAAAVLTNSAVSDAVGRGSLRGEHQQQQQPSDAAANADAAVPADILQVVEDLRFIDPFEGFDFNQMLPMDDNNAEDEGESDYSNEQEDRRAVNIGSAPSESKHSKVGGHYREPDFEAQAEGGATDGDDVQVEARIVGGSVESTWKPWMAMTLEYNDSNGQHYRGACGAAMITDTWAVTAAHCVSNYAKNDLAYKMDALYVGAYKPWQSNAGKEYEKITIASIVEHPNHNAGAANPNDIALLRLERPVSFDGFYPLKIPSYSPSSTQANRRGVAYGFGQTSYGGSKSDELRSVEVGYVTNSKCDAAMSSWSITDDMVCFAAPSKDSCGGDSGGPLVVNGDTLFGAVSWGYKCAEAGYPGVYSSTYEASGWMQGVMGSDWNDVVRSSSQGSLETYAGNQYSSGGQTGYNSGGNTNPAPAPAPAPLTATNRCVDDKDFKVKIQGNNGQFKCKDVKKNGNNICNDRSSDSQFYNMKIDQICCDWC